MAASPGGKEVGRISIAVVPDTSGFRAALARQLQVIEDSLKATIQADVELDTLKARGDMAVLMGRLKAQARDGVTINTKVDQSVLGKLFSGVGGGASGAAGGLGGMSRGLGIVAAVAALAAPALALISGVLITLPALITAVLTPIAAIALGLDGIKKAAEVLKDPLDNLKATMSTAFQDKLTPIFKDLRAVFPVLNQEMPKVANGLGDMARSLVDSVTSGPGMEAIRNTISNIGKALTDAAPGVGNFTDGFLKLISSVSNKLPNLSKIFNGWGDSFTNWVNKITTPSWFDGKTPLDNGLKSFKDTLNEILGLVGDLGNAGFDFLSDPNFGQKMKDFVADIKDLVVNVLPGLGKFFEDLSGVLSDLKATTEAIGKLPEWAKPNSQVDRGNPKNKDGSKKDTSNIFEPFTSPDAGWRTMWADIDKAAADTEAWMETTWGQFTGYFAQQGAAIAGGWNANWETMKAVFSSTVSWFKTTWGQLTAFFTQQGSVIAAAWTANWEMIKSGFAATVSWLQTTWGQFTGFFSQSWAAIASAATTGWASVVAVVQGALGSIGSFFTGIPAALSAAWGGLSGIASTAWNAVVSAVATAMAGAVSAVVTGAAQVVAEVVALGGKVVSACAGFGTLLLGAGAALIQGLIDGIGSLADAAISKAVGIATSVANAVKGALGIHSPSTVFTDIGAQTMQGLQDGLEGGFQGVIDRATALTQQLTDAINGGLTGVDGKALSTQLKQQMAEIGLQSDELKIQLNNTTDKGQKDGIRGQRKQLQDLRDQLNLQQDQLGYSQKYGESVDSNNDSNKMATDLMDRMVGLGRGFADATTGQFMTDIGMSGNGAVPQLAGMGVDFMTSMLSNLMKGGLQTNIHVNSLDEALAAKSNITNKQALQYRTR